MPLVTGGAERLLAAAGIGFAAALALTGLVDSHDADAYLTGLAALFLVAYLGALRAALRWIEGETAPLSATAVIGGSAAAAVYLVLSLAYASVADRLESSVNLEGFAFAVSFAQAAVLGAAGGVMARTGVVSRALGVAGLALVPVQLAAPLVLLSSSSRGAVALALAPFAVWVAATSLVLVRAPGRPDGP
jgi:hypothetical protein